MKEEKSDEFRNRVFWFIRKTVLRIGDQNGPIYLIRYSLLTLPWFYIKLHKILLSDDDCMHDHLWSFISIILFGGYHEITPIEEDGGKRFWNLKNRKFQWYGPGSILWRPAPSPHSLILPQNKIATTLVITFKKVRVWGFITPSGWKPWYEYIRSGRKCE